MVIKYDSRYLDVCYKLNYLSVLMLEAMKEYMDCKVILENYLKTGSLHLAKARYIMGNKSVSSLQLPTEDCDILAQTKVLSSKHKSGSSEELVFKLSKLSMDDKETESNIKHRNTKSAADDGKNIGDSDSITKTRRNKKKSSTKSSLSDDESNDKLGNKNRSVSNDPIKWFGVLVPQNLKYAQNNYTTALDYVIQCANIQSRMNDIRLKYVNLMAKKAELLTES